MKKTITALLAVATVAGSLSVTPAYDDCYWQRQRFWDGYGWRVRNVRVCG